MRLLGRRIPDSHFTFIITHLAAMLIVKRLGPAARQPQAPLSSLMIAIKTASAIHSVLERISSRSVEFFARNLLLDRLAYLASTLVMFSVVARTRCDEPPSCMGRGTR